MGGWLLWESGVYKRAHVPEPSVLTSVSMSLSSSRPNPQPCFHTQPGMSGKLWPQSLTGLPAGPGQRAEPTAHSKTPEAGEDKRSGKRSLGLLGKGSPSSRAGGQSQPPAPNAPEAGGNFARGKREVAPNWPRAAGSRRSSLGSAANSLATLKHTPSPLEPTALSRKGQNHSR